MLARVANNLYWMGRYIERAEHVARFLNVNYFSSLDAPSEISQGRQFVLRSIKFMVGEPATEADNLIENDVLYDVGLNLDKYYSVKFCIKVARENANSSRDLISTELYEAINKFYHYVNDYPSEVFVKNGLYDYAVNVTERTAILRGKIRGTLLHDEIYHIIMLGINIERANQIIRIINAKYNDAIQAKGSYTNPVNNSYEWTTLLKCAESYDMMRRFYKKPPNGINTLDFLIFNQNCPRSVMNSLNQVFKHLQELDPQKIRDKNSAAFLIGKVRAEYQFKHFHEVQNQVKNFIENTVRTLVEIGNKLEKEYFNY
ncbi:alpha-E domain-containing protein [Aegicerativicinus sediminis]|uniref:alpha-E domain-containing protein n=1 Tax=Aegicerativicinus sediminis TaxID=2893202 RepID=UPI001E334A5E|nr:alpha-E domain-containing protein [Aegicerativicinus sediminis]